MTSHPDAFSARRILSGSALGLVARVVAAGFSMVSGIVLARALGASSLGSFGLALTLSAIAIQLTDFGFSQSIVGFLVHDERQRSAELSAVVAMRLLGSAALQLCILGFAAAGGFGSAATTVAIVSVTIPLTAVSAVSAALQARMRLHAMAALSFGRAASWCAVVVLLAASGASLEAFAVCYTLLEGCTAAVTLYLAHSSVRLSTTDLKRAMKPVWSASWRLGVMGAAVTLYYRIDTIVVFSYAGDTIAGYYTVAYRIIDLVQILPAVLLVPVLPLVARATHANDIPRAGRLFADSLVLGLAIALPFALVLPLRAGDLLAALFGPEYGGGGTILALLSMSFVGITAGWIGTTVAAGSGGIGLLWLASIGAAFLSLALNLVLVPLHGPTWSAAITVFIETAVGTAALAVAAHRTEATIPTTKLARILACTAVIAALVLVTRALPVIPVALAVTPLYLALLFVSRAVPPTLVEILRRKPAGRIA